jgi:colanic acid biosynthesis glycosyl transferase WcaI
MRILLVTQAFPPERGPTGHMFYELGADLARKGHRITVITGFPNHPYGRVFGGYRKRLFQVEEMAGMRVIRMWLFTSPNRRPLNRIFTFMTFTLSSALAGLSVRNQDILFAVLQPLTVGLTYPLLGKLAKTKVVFSLQDLHPDAAIDAGLVTNRLFIRLLRLIETWAYANADHICATCRVFRDHVISKGTSPSKVSVIYNWIDTEEIRPLSRENDFRTECGFTAKDFVVLYAGNIGYSSGADLIIESAKMLRDKPEVKFLFVGEGPAKSAVQESARSGNLKNVFFVPFQARERVPLVHATADVSLLTMQPGWAKTSVGFASKVLAYMAAGRPVIASVDLDSEMAEVVGDANCGIVAAAGDARALANAVSKLYEAPTLCLELGANGRRYVERHFSRRIVVQEHLSLFESVVRGAGGKKNGEGGKELMSW